MQQFQLYKHLIIVLPLWRLLLLEICHDMDRQHFHDKLLLKLLGQYYSQINFQQLELLLAYSLIRFQIHPGDWKQDLY